MVRPILKIEARPILDKNPLSSASTANIGTLLTSSIPWTAEKRQFFSDDVSGALQPHNQLRLLDVQAGEGRILI